MKRRNNLSYILIMIVLAALFLSLAGCGGTGKAERTADIAVLYTGDVHCAVDENIGYAGLASFKTVLETQGTQVLLVDTGDAIQGAPLGSMSKGSIPIEIINQLGYCAMTLGNHEFDYGQDALWDAVQQTVDAAKKDGADYVIALTHLGIDTATAPYLSTEMIAGMFTGVEGERRVQSVMVGGKQLESAQTYSLAGTDYTLRDSGDGYSLFAGCPVLEADLGLDFDALSDFLSGGYLKDTSLYAQAYGDGRVVAVP